jgi:hypothetical protein
LRIKPSVALIAIILAATLHPAHGQARVEAIQPSEGAGATVLGDSGVKVLGATRPPVEPLAPPLPDDDPPPISEDLSESGEEITEEPPPTYRTMCVRLCDGYFYPMSYAVAPDLFERDRTRCEASCPGTSMELFYGETAVEATGKLQSRRTGEFYADLPAAFLHRKTGGKVPANCTCTVPRKGVNIIAGEPPRGDDEPNILGEISGPISRTRAGSKKALVVPIVPSGSVVEMPLPGGMKPSPPETTASPPPGKRRIRVVSPELLPDRSGAEDQQDRVPRQGP